MQGVRAGLLLFLALVTPATGSVPRRADVRRLEAGVTLSQQTLHLNGGSCVYELHGLRAFSSYEIKISYPATSFAEFKLELEEVGSIQSRRLQSMRKILDIEKIVYVADDRLRVPGDHWVNVVVTVHSTNVPPKWGVKLPRDGQVVFNIVCEELRWGLPLRAWRVAAIAAGSLAVLILILCTLPTFPILEGEPPVRSKLF